MSSSDDDDSTSNLLPLSASFLLQIIAVRDCAWREFQDARTRSEKRRTADAYIRLANSFSSRWPRTKSFFDQYFYAIGEWLDEPTFCPPGTPFLSWEAFQQIEQIRWADPPAFVAFVQSQGPVQVRSSPADAPSSSTVTRAPSVPSDSPASATAEPVPAVPDAASSSSTVACAPSRCTTT